MPSEILDQAAIDAMLDGAAPATADAAPQPADGTPVRQYDFGTQARVVRGRMPTLEMISERLARALRLSIPRMLGKSPEISVLGVSTPKYSDYIPTLTVPTSLNRIRFQPLSGTGLIIFEASLVFAVIDSFFGGRSRHAKIEGRDFTPTENDIIRMLVELTSAGLKEAWAPVLPAKVECVGTAMNPYFINLVSPTEIVVVSRLRVEIDGKGGEIHVTLPWNMLGPIKDTLRAGVQSDRAGREELWSRSLRSHLEESNVDLVTRVASARVTLRSLMDMRAGDIIPCQFDGHVQVLAGGVPLFQGELGQRHGRHVVQISQMAIRKTANSLDKFVVKTP